MNSSAKFHTVPKAALAIAVSAMVVLGGCANSEDGDGGSESGGNSSDGNGEEQAANDSDGLMPAGEGTTEYPLTLPTTFGESVLQERPERIAVVGLSPNVDALEALDVAPVYTIGPDFDYEWSDEAWQERIETVDTATRRDPINFEAIALADPDLIVANGAVADEAEFQKLSEIAPVLDAPEAPERQSDLPWQDTQRMVGDALDLSEAAEAVVTEAEASIERIAQDNEAFADKTITMAYDYGQEYGIDYYTYTGGPTEEVMIDLGFSPNPLAEDFVDDPTVSDENQNLLDADALIMVYSNDDDRQTREEQALFQDLAPVSEGRYLSLTFNENNTLDTADGAELPNAVWVLRGGRSALSMPWAVDVVANQWLAQIDLS